VLFHQPAVAVVHIEESCERTSGRDKFGLELNTIHAGRDGAVNRLIGINLHDSQCIDQPPRVNRQLIAHRASRQLIQPGVKDRRRGSLGGPEPEHFVVYAGVHLGAKQRRTGAKAKPPWTLKRDISGDCRRAGHRDRTALRL
jgi:hypothetical protein